MTAAEAEVAVDADATVQPTTADEAEAIAKALDAERAAVAARYREHNRYMPTGADPAWSAVAQELTREGLRLDREKAAAWKLARQLRDKEIRRNQWRAAHEVWGEHRELCGRARELLDELLPLLEAEKRLHEMLKDAAGASQLQPLYADLDALRQMRRRAALVADPPTEAAA